MLSSPFLDPFYAYNQDKLELPLHSMAQVICTAVFMALLRFFHNSLSLHVFEIHHCSSRLTSTTVQCCYYPAATFHSSVYMNMDLCACMLTMFD